MTASLPKNTSSNGSDLAMFRPAKLVDSSDGALGESFGWIDCRGIGQQTVKRYRRQINIPVVRLASNVIQIHSIRVNIILMMIRDARNLGTAIHGLTFTFEEPTNP
jgi:hypothetical protein